MQRENMHGLCLCQLLRQCCELQALLPKDLTASKDKTNETTNAPVRSAMFSSFKLYICRQQLRCFNIGLVCIRLSRNLTVLRLTIPLVCVLSRLPGSFARTGSSIAAPLATTEITSPAVRHARWSCCMGEATLDCHDLCYSSTRPLLSPLNPTRVLFEDSVAASSPPCEELSHVYGCPRLSLRLHAVCASFQKQKRQA